MLLVLDIGNSNIVMGAYDGAKLLRHWRISTDRQKTGDEYGILINELFRYQGLSLSDIQAIIISSVVPPYCSCAPMTLTIRSAPMDRGFS